MMLRAHRSADRPGTRVPIWLRLERHGRGPRPAHTRADIAAACVRVADDDGIEAVSMRRIAWELGVGATSLYRYVATKGELFELMVDRVMGEQRPPTPTGDWRADLRALAHAARARALRHRWLASLPAARPTLGPNSLLWLEATYTAMDVTGLTADDVLVRVDTLLTFVRGHVIEELAEQDSARRSGRDLSSWLTVQSAYGEAIIGSGRYPHLSRIMLEAETPHADDRYERAFRHGLDLVLAGLET